MRRESTAALSADRPSVQDLLYLETPSWLKLWRNWRRLNFKVWFLLELEMFSVTSVLEENTKPSSPVWCVRNLTVKLILSVMRTFIHVSHTKWSMPLDDCRRWSARNMRSFLRFSVALIRDVYVCCVWMNIKTTTLSQLQHRGQRNRYLTLDTKEIMRQQKWTAAVRRVHRNTVSVKIQVSVCFTFILKLAVPYASC